MAKKDFEKSLRLLKISLLLSGIKITKTKWSKSLERFYDYFLYYFSQSWLYIDVCGELYWVAEGVLTGKSFVDLSLTAPCITISLLGTFKTIFLYLHRDIVVNIVEKLRDIHPEDDIDEYAQIENVNEGKADIITGRLNNETTETEHEIVKESSKFLNIVVQLQYYMCVVVVCAFCLLPATTMAYDYYMTGSTECKYPYLVKYFFDPYTMKLCPAVYLHHVISTMVVGANIIGTETLFYTVCIYIQMHFRILCRRCERAVASTTKGTRENVANAVRRHQDLIHLVDQVEILYSKSTLFNIVTSSLLICLCGFIITVIEDISLLVTFATFLFMSLSQIFLLCYFGDMLMRSSTEISLAVYSSSWYETDQWTKKNLLLMIMRAQKPCKLTACNFADLNLTAFTTILSRSWSYFALLKTMTYK